MAVEDSFTHEQPVDRDAQLRRTIENYDELLDDQWELEMGMDPAANLPGDAGQVHDDDEPFRRSLSPEMAAPSLPPSAVVGELRRSPSVEFVDQPTAPSVRTADPPHFEPVGSNSPNDILATREELSAWATSVRELSASTVHSTFGRAAACIWGTSTQVVAKTFLALLTHILRSDDGTRPRFQAPEGASRVSEGANVASFAQTDCYLQV